MHRRLNQSGLVVGLFLGREADERTKRGIGQSLHWTGTCAMHDWSFYQCVTIAMIVRGVKRALCDYDQNRVWGVARLILC
jgi:hypothetical protein